MNSVRYRTRCSQLLEVTQSGSGARLCFDACLRANAVLRARRRELLRAALKVAKHTTNASIASSDNAIQIDDVTCLDEILPAVMRRIDSIAMRPCTPELVTTLLGIRSLECIRWTKDLRLPVCGSIATRNSSGTACPVYRAQDIAMLACRPDIIETWRYEDARQRLRCASAAESSPTTDLSLRVPTVHRQKRPQLLS